MEASDSDSHAKNDRRAKLPRVKGWFVLLLGFVIGAGYLYYLNLEHRKQFINSYYFRTLQEAATELNNNLDQVASLHRYGESESTILSIFPSYQALRVEDAAADRQGYGKGPCPSGSDSVEKLLRLFALPKADGEIDADGRTGPARVACEETLSSDADSGPGNHTYVLEANRLKISGRRGEFTVDMAEILPAPHEDFSHYLIADTRDNVLATSLGASGLSLINTRFISRAIQQRENENWLKLAAREAFDATDAAASMPGYSTQIEMQLGTGKSRVFVLPFLLHHDVALSAPAPAATAIDAEGASVAANSRGVPVYLLGIQPESATDAYENKRWNVSLLLLSLSALVFLWCVTRLLMLSRHQPIGGIYYRLMVSASYLTFILLVALLLAFAQRDAAITLKQERARTVLADIRNGVADDLNHILMQIDGFHPVYAAMLEENQGIEADTDASRDDSTEAVSYTCKAEGTGDVLTAESPVCADAECGKRQTGGTTLLINKCGVLRTVYLQPAEQQRNRAAASGTIAPSFRHASFMEETRDLGAHIMQGDYQLPRFSLIDVFGSDASVLSTENGEIDVRQSFDSKRESPPGGGRLLSVFLMNEDGHQVLPTFYFRESNKPPQSYSLAHRDYFRRVRDQTGWQIALKCPAQSGAQASVTTTDWPGSGYMAGVCSSDKPSPTIANVYIQRLLNINSGTRGSTLGMPLRWIENGESKTDARYIVGADIVIPALSFGELRHASLLQDAVVMVIDRVSGQVLYHMDADRSMVENLYQAGRGAAGIELRVSTGRLDGRTVPGYYHGKPGDFLAAGLPVGQWATVVFVPDSSTDSLMTNAFLANAAGMSLAITMLAFLVYVVRRLRDSESLRQRWDMPLALNRHTLILFSSIVVASVYVGFRLGGAVTAYLWPGGAGLHVSFVCSLVALTATVAWGYLVLQRMRRDCGGSTSMSGQVRNGDVILAGLALVFGIGLACYLLRVGDEPENDLDRYYRSVYEARLNKERSELQKIALTRYPNTVKLEGRDPLTLVAVDDCWREALGGPATDARVRGAAAGARPGQDARYVMPDAVGTFSQYTASTAPYDLARRYLLGLEPRSAIRELPPEPDEGSLAQGAGAKRMPGCNRATAGNAAGNADPSPSAGDSDTGGDADTRPEGHTVNGEPGADTVIAARFVTVHTGLFVLLCALWYLFFRWILNARLVGSPGLFEHLRIIVSRNVPERTYSPRPGLVLDLHCEQGSGEELASLAHRHARAATADSSEVPASGGGPESTTTRGLRLLLRECPWLAPREGESDLLPGVRIRMFDVAPDSERQVEQPGQREAPGCHLSALDASLSQAASRNALLRVIRRLKAMQIQGELAELRLGVDFHSYEALLLKAHNIESEREPMTDLEFARWAETLMDFSVDLPEELTREVCPAFLHYECGSRGNGDTGTGLLRGLAEDIPAAATAEGASTTWRQRRRWLALRDVTKTGREWATINCILLKAGALFRYKWENCSNAEKLALYYLAKRWRINAANAQLLEQLALQGLIRVDHGRVRIVNNSFAYFVRHAEDAPTLKHLVDLGEDGVWQEYRLPVTLVVLLLLGGIALTSGNSLYVVVASLLGLLGTIGSLTSSARLIRENLR